MEKFLIFLLCVFCIAIILISIYTIATFGFLLWCKYTACILFGFCAFVGIVYFQE